MDINNIQSHTAEELSKDPKILKISTENLPREIFLKIYEARGIIKDIQDSANFELPKNDIEIHFYPDQKTVFNRHSKATFFVLQSCPKKEGDERDFFGQPLYNTEMNADSKIIVVFTKPIECTHGTCGVSSLTNFKKTFQDISLRDKGIGTIIKKSNKIEIQWGTCEYVDTQKPNQNADRYFGPYPSKFAEWIKNQIETNLQEKLSVKK